jgi:glycosyltransferase involved in cell wall biosynthesis
VNDIAFEFTQKGYEITVITAIPDYPQGKFYNGYSLFRRRREFINKVHIIRLPIIPRKKGKKIDLVLNYVSYFISALIFTFFHSYTDKYDMIFVHLTSPFFIGLPAVILKHQQHIPLIFWVLDLWPESLLAAGGIKNGFIFNVQIKIVRFVYNNCDKILIGSRGFGKSICEKGNYDDKLIYFPNWAEDIIESNNIMDTRNIFPFCNFIEENFILLFAGNMGEAQNLDMLIEAANLVKEISNIKWVFLGEGRKCIFLKNRVGKLNLEKNVFFPGRFPIETMPQFMKMADILLVSLKDEKIFNLTVPSKVQYYMSQGKPILAMLNGDGANLIIEANCGFCVPAGDYKKCAETVMKIYNNRKILQSLGLNGKKYYEKYFGKKERIDQLEKIITGMLMS